MNIEVKSISRGKGVRLSSIKGWEIGKLPKLLVLVYCKKIRAPPIPRFNGTQTKARDIEVKIEGYSLHYFDHSTLNLFVDWPEQPTFEEVTRVKWKERPNFYEDLKHIARDENNKSMAPIKLRVEKNGKRCRIHYAVKGSHLLPTSPSQIRQSFSEKLDPLIGAVLKLWKDNTSGGGASGYLDENMILWEDQNTKSTGRLDVILSTNETLSFPTFKQGRQDYWSGFGIETLIAYLNDDLNKTPGGTLGADFTLNSLISSNIEIDELKRASKAIGKHKILRSIQKILLLPQYESDVSKGSTVTRTSLQPIADKIAITKGILPIGKLTKAQCISTSLELLGQRSDSDDVSRGGTVTAFALFKIYKGLTS